MFLLWRSKPLAERHKAELGLNALFLIDAVSIYRATKSAQHLPRSWKANMGTFLKTSVFLPKGSKKPVKYNLEMLDKNIMLHNKVEVSSLTESRVCLWKYNNVRWQS